MSQASRSHALRLVRERERVARFISTVEVGYGQARNSSGDWVMSSRAGAVLRGLHFDVHAAREAAQALVKLEAEQAVFEDWCRERGKGPDNRGPGAFDNVHGPAYGGVVCRVCRCPSGGWPGKLAREWPGDTRAPMGRTLAKLGRRVLAALEGQPSECPWRTLVDGEWQHDPVAIVCPDCHGTGHNLRGTLPDVAWPAVVRRKAADWLDSTSHEHDHACWLVDVDEGDTGDLVTRVIPRGWHGHHGHWPSALEAHRSAAVGTPERQTALDLLISERLWDSWSSPDDGSHAPAWRRGGLRHALGRLNTRGLQNSVTYALAASGLAASVLSPRPHALEYSVRGGATDDSIARTIFEHSAAGIELVGTTTVQLETAWGEHAICFTRV